MQAASAPIILIAPTTSTPAISTSGKAAAAPSSNSSSSLHCQRLLTSIDSTTQAAPRQTQLRVTKAIPNTKFGT
jgi:hypothetical protein